MSSLHFSHMNRGFSLVEALIMIVVLVIFSMLLYGVLRKDFLRPTPAPQQQEYLPGPVSSPKP